MSKWLVKVRQYTGGTSVIDSFDNEKDAISSSVMHNQAYQTDKYYVELWDPAKLVGFDSHLTNKDQ